MFQVLRITAGGRLRQREGKEKDTDTRWTAFEWLHGSHFIVFCLAHSSAFFCLLSARTSPNSESSSSSLLPFSLSLIWADFPPTFLMAERDLLTLALLFSLTHSPTHPPSLPQGWGGGAPAHSFTWFKHGTLAWRWAHLRFAHLHGHTH